MNKPLPSKDALETLALDLFKAGFEAAGYSKVVALGADKMPRQAYAKAAGYAIAAVAAEFDTDCLGAANAVLATVVGNASQLGAKLFKEKWLTEATAEVAADDLLAKMRASLAARNA